MKQYTMREMEVKDLKSVKEIISKTWNMGRLAESETVFNGAMDILVNDILNKSTFSRVAVIDEEVIGFILGSKVGETATCRLLQQEISGSLQALMMATEQEMMNMMEYINQTFTTYHELVVDYISEFDGCVEFFAVSEKARGLKIGQALWNELHAYFQTTNASNVYLYTDTTCNYGFYDYNGFERRNETVATFNLNQEEETKTVFLYDYKIKKS